MDAAESEEIDFQRQTVSRSTGTDTDSFAYSAEGVPSALISLPLKYMHTTVETVELSDIESVIKLMYATLQHIKPGQTFSYFD
jgi:putative aminopeptidase FrvX